MMKKFVLACCFMLGITAMTYAQGRMRRSPEEQAKNLQTQLKLTDDQTAKITAIYAAQAKSRDSLMTASNGDRQAAFQAMRPLMQATNDKIKALLTADQAAQFAKYQQEQMERRRQMMNGGGGAPPSPNN
jgi:Spy/CpxP family protein refolding chaperone